MKRFIWLGVASSMVLGLSSVQAEFTPGQDQAPRLIIKHNGKQVTAPFTFEQGEDGVFRVVNPGGITLPDQAQGNFDIIEITEVRINTDPFIIYSFNATDNGAASDFEFIFESPVNPLVVNPATVQAGIGFSLTASTNPGNGNPITAELTPMQANLQISELGFMGSFQNAGVDVGSGQMVSSGTRDFSDIAGDINTFETSATGPFDMMRVTTSFSLSGQGAAAGGSGNFVLNQIPEPSTSLLIGFGLIGLAGMARFKAKS